MTTYSQILLRSWRQTWVKKSLWLFGVLAAFLGVGGEISTASGLSSSQSIFFNIYNALLRADLFSWQSIKNIPGLFVDSPLSFIIPSLLYLIVFVVILILLVLAVISQVVIIYSVARGDVGKKSSFSQSLSVGINKFFPLLGINLLAKISAFVTLLFFAYIALQVDSLIAIIIVAIVYIVLLSLTFVISFVARYAICYAVLNDESFLPSLKTGLNIFWSNKLITFEIAIILLIINLIRLFIILILSAIALFVLYVVFATAQILQLSFLATTSLALALLALLAIGLFFTSIYTVFAWSNWAILYIEITQKNVSSRLVAAGKKIKSWVISG